MTDKIIAPPPLIFLGAYLIGAGAQQLLPYPLLAVGFEWVAWPVLLLGSAVLIWAGATLKNQGTPLSPHETPTTLVTSGPYRFSRNPIYVGLALVYASMAVYSNALIVALMLPLALIVLMKGVIRVEEARLHKHFRKEYAQYKARVRRWL